MNKRYIKGLLCLGIGLEVIAGIFLIGIIVTNYLFKTHYLIPDLIMTLFCIGLAVSLFASLLKVRLKNYKM